MAKLTANNLTARQVSGWQAETDKYNAEKTAEYARRNPPEVWTALTVDQRFEMRIAEVGDRHADESDQVEINDLVAKYKAAGQAKRDAIKNAAK